MGLAKQPLFQRRPRSPQIREEFAVASFTPIPRKGKDRKPSNKGPPGASARWALPKSGTRLHTLGQRIGNHSYSDGMVTGLSSEGSGASRPGARRCPSSRPGPVPRVSATSPNPFWRPKPLSLRPAILPTLHRPSRGPRRSLPVVPSIWIEGTTGRLRWGCGGMSGR